MSSDVFARGAFFRAFGFAVQRGALSAAEVTRLRGEADAAIREATGPWYRRRSPGGGIEGHDIPATGRQTPFGLELAERFSTIAEQLVGMPLLFAFGHHTLFFDAAGWHTDTGHAIPSIKAAAYLERLDASNGALRVLPGSHAIQAQQFRPIPQGGAPQDAATARRAITEVPAAVLATRPGDVIIFDEHLWHASVGGHDRLQWSAVSVKEPTSVDEDAAVRGVLASAFEPDEHGLDDDPRRSRYYGDHFRRRAPTRWVRELDRLGAFAAAAAEEATGQRAVPR